MSTSTKFISSAAVAAPVLSGTAGAMITLLDAVLATGFGAQVASSVTVAGNVATVLCPSPHSQIVDGVALLSGATPSGLNGEKRVLSVTTNSYTFAAPGIADGVATGTITAKVAPLGWTKQFAGTNLAAYKSLDVTATGMALRVDDTGSTSARVRGYEVMTDVDTGTGPFPSVAQVASTGLYWSKSNSADSVARSWFVVGDARGFYMFVRNLTTAAHQGVFFGDIQCLKSNDPYGAVLRGSSGDISTKGTVYQNGLEYSDSLYGQTTCAFWPRDPNALGGSAYCVQEAALAGATQYYSGSSSTTLTYPSQVDNGLVLVAPRVFRSGLGIRGTMPGLYFSPQALVASFESGDVVVGNGELSGAKLGAIKLGALGAGATSAVVFLDVSSDWRA